MNCRQYPQGEVYCNSSFPPNTKIHSNSFSPSEIALLKATLSAQIEMIPSFSILHPEKIFPLLVSKAQPTL